MKEHVHNFFKGKNKKRNILVLIISFAAVLAAACLFGFSVWNNAQPRVKSTDEDAVKVVNKYLTALKNNDYDAYKSVWWCNYYEPKCDPDEEEYLGVLSLSITKVRISEKETQLTREDVKKGSNGGVYGWPKGITYGNVIAVYAHYTIAYNRTKGLFLPAKDGDFRKFVYLVRKDEYSPWLILWQWGKCDENDN